jgi:hypothetical protein
MSKLAFIFSLPDIPYSSSQHLSLHFNYVSRVQVSIVLLVIKHTAKIIPHCPGIVFAIPRVDVVPAVRFFLRAYCLNCSTQILLHQMMP